MLQKKTRRHGNKNNKRRPAKNTNRTTSADLKKIRIRPLSRDQAAKKAAARAKPIRFRIGLLRTYDGYFFKKRATYPAVCDAFLRKAPDLVCMDSSLFFLESAKAAVSSELGILQLIVFDAILKPECNITTALICEPDGVITSVEYAGTDWTKTYLKHLIRADCGPGYTRFDRRVLSYKNAAVSRTGNPRAVLIWPGYFSPLFLYKRPELPVKTPVVNNYHATNFGGIPVAAVSEPEPELFSDLGFATESASESPRLNTKPPAMFSDIGFA